MRVLLLALFCFITNIASAQQTKEARPFEGHFYSAESQVDLYLNLYEEDILVPNFDFLGKMNGYMNGKGIYGTWMLLKHTINGNKATLRFSNDIGSDVQDAELTLNADSTYSFRTINKNALRRAVNRNILKFQGI